MNFELNLVSPYDKHKPHYKQQEYLEIDRSQPGTTRSHYTGGRGSAKTSAGLLLAIQAAYVLMPGHPGMWTEPTGGLCHDVFIREWRKVVPSELYKLNLSKMTITCLHTGRNGRPDTIIDIRSRNADNPSREIQKGPNYAWIIEDEMAVKCDRRAIEKYEDLDATIRANTPHSFHDTLSTPKMNEYYGLAHRPGHHLVEGTSYDNPHNPDSYADDLASQMNRARMEQEILGKWVALSGLIYPEWSTKFWPHGNVLQHAAHDHDDGYFLFLDLGVATSAWLLAQQKVEDGQQIWVATAEYCPEGKGDTDRMCRQIKADYGNPVRVVCGHDVSTRSTTTADKPIHYIRKHFGGSVPVTPVSGWIADKEIQHSQVSYLIHDTQGRRQFCIAEHFRSHGSTDVRNGVGRGLREVTTQYAWDKDDKKRMVTFFPKPHRLEHMNDAWAYGTVGCMAPPNYRYQMATAV